MRRLISSLLLLVRDDGVTMGTDSFCYVPEPPPGFVRRSDPNFYFLARKF